MPKDEKTTIRHNGDLMRRADGLAARAGLSRNRLIEIAIDQFVADADPVAVRELDVKMRNAEANRGQPDLFD